MARTDTKKPTTVRFYQLGVSSLEAAVTGILTKAWAKGVKSTLLTPGPDPSRYWDALLWRSPAEAFLPHGLASNPDPQRQPVLIASDQDDQNGATLIVLVTPRMVTTPEQYDMVIDFVDGSSQEALLASRSRYKQYRDQGCQLEYWIQTPDRKWSLKNRSDQVAAEEK
jgi:DNA polymerase III subunit chi